MGYEDYDSSFSHHRLSRRLASPGIFPGTFGCMVSHSGILYRPGTSRNWFALLIRCFSRFLSETRRERRGARLGYNRRPPRTTTNVYEGQDRCIRCSGPRSFRTLAVTAWRSFTGCGCIGLRLNDCAHSVSSPNSPNLFLTRFSRRVAIAHRKRHARFPRTLQTLEPATYFRARRTGAAGWYSEYLRRNGPHTIMIHARRTLRMDQVGPVRGLVNLGEHGNDLRRWSDGGLARALHWAPRF
ncbi:hypothetical protein DFP72DRAFT_194685 [Ephemerocybe angulata]|uniref:Uncharacterized protein n=1 Tax=Ephemerocybe angulata TaxID=980116 RepID=A0A8H6H8C2_9AGAR|nr:hypothetical protein DFP72DRAFT_194685 [Tulosesus angulatus]